MSKSAANGCPHHSLISGAAHAKRRPLSSPVSSTLVMPRRIGESHVAEAGRGAVTATGYACWSSSHQTVSRGRCSLPGARLRPPAPPPLTAHRRSGPASHPGACAGTSRAMRHGCSASWPLPPAPFGIELLATMDRGGRGGTPRPAAIAIARYRAMGAMAEAASAYGLEAARRLDERDGAGKLSTLFPFGVRQQCGLRESCSRRGGLSRRDLHCAHPPGTSLPEPGPTLRSAFSARESTPTPSGSSVRR